MGLQCESPCCHRKFFEVQEEGGWGMRQYSNNSWAQRSSCWCKRGKQLQTALCWPKCRSANKTHCNAVSGTKMPPFAPAIAHCIRHADGVCVCVPLCARSLPMPGASQTWGVKRSLRMGFSNTGSSGRAASKRRQLEMPSLRVCVRCDCGLTCVWCLCSHGQTTSPCRKRSIWRASHDSDITVIHHTRKHGTFNDFCQTVSDMTNVVKWAERPQLWESPEPLSVRGSYKVAFMHLPAVSWEFCTDIYQISLLPSSTQHNRVAALLSCAN